MSKSISPLKKVSKHCLRIDTTAVKPRTFIDALSAVCPDKLWPLVCEFEQAPKIGNWTAQKLTDFILRKLYHWADKNRYITISVFKGNKRRKTEFVAMVAVMIDDVGTKVPFEKIVLPPTYWLETSPGNFQAWYFLKVPVRDRQLAESVLNALVAQGLATDGTDPGMKGVTRYGRLPGGWNNKESLDKPHRVKAYEDVNGCNYHTIEEIIEKYELDLAAVASKHSGDIGGEIDQLDILTAQNDPIYKMLDSLGLIKYIQGHKIEITCPWVDDHTGGVDNGTALLIKPGGGLGFKCHHGHDEHKTLKDVHDWLYENCPEEYDKYYPPKEPDENAEDTLESELQQLIDDDIDGSELTGKITDLADEYGRRPDRLEKQFFQMRKEAETQESAAEAITQLDDLEAIKGSILPIEEGLYGDGGELADALIATAEAMPTAPEFLATTLIPVLASRIGTSATLILNAKGNYTVSPIFRTIIVAPTGRKKTPAQKSIISVVSELEKQAYQRYQTELEAYELALETWKRDDGPPPEKPTRKRFFSNDDTLAARIQVHSENPRGILLYRDEASAYFNERGRFANGRGDGGETEADLSEFNGGSLSRDRKGDGSIFLEKTAISRTGAIQYIKLQELMGDHRDSCGEWARYLFCAADAPLAYIDLLSDDGDTGLRQTLIALLEILDELSECEYYLSSNQAKIAFMEYQHELTDRAVATDHPSMQAAFPKFESYFGRFILLLHIVNAVLAGKKPSTTIGARTVDMARRWTEYFVGQFRLLMALNSPQEELTGHLLQLKNYIERKPGKTGRQIAAARLFAANLDKSKHRKAYLDSLLTELVDKGHISEVDGKYSVNPGSERATNG
ncbi:MAG: DUF3987 domain-containing protein [Leptolyngbyaceae cyanobacterium]